MKRIVMALLMAAMVTSLTACGGNAGQGGSSVSDTLDREQSPVPAGAPEEASVQPETDGTPEASGDAAVAGTDSTDAADSRDVPSEEGSKALVAYFSATGTTKGVAGIIAEYMGADIYEIVPQEPYTDADLDWHDDKSRSTIEMNDSSSRPGIDGTVEDMEQYDIVFIGYPNWWASIPMPIASFLEEYDLSGKTIVPFCSHGGGRFGQSLTAIAKLAPDSTIGEGLAISYSGGSGMPDDVAAWLEENGIAVQ